FRRRRHLSLQPLALPVRHSGRLLERRPPVTVPTHMSQQAFPTIYLVLHATPDWSRTDIPYHIPPGPPLTAVGESEAAKLGDFLRDMQASQILCSPLVRCLRTAEIAAEKAGIPHTIDNRLAEVQPQEKPGDRLARGWAAR